MAALLLYVFLAYLVFALAYRVPDVAVFTIPASMMVAIAAGMGVHLLVQASGRWRGVVAAVVVGLLGITWVPVFQAGIAQNDLSHKTDVHDYGRDVLAQNFPPDARLVGILGEMTLVRYFQATEQLRPALVTIAADRDEERTRVIERELQAGHAVFTTRPLTGLPEKYALGALGPLVRVWAAPPRDTLPADAARVGTIRYRVDALTQPSPSLVRVQLTWQPSARSGDDLKVSARLLEGDRLVAQQDDWPVHNAYHTPFWREGETIADVYDVRVPPDVSSASLRVLLIVYHADSGTEVGRIEAGTLNAP